MSDSTSTTRLPAGLALKGMPQFTPTFVLIQNGKELGRIEGYPGPDFFWALLDQLLQKTAPEPATPKSAAVAAPPGPEAGTDADFDPRGEPMKAPSLAAALILSASAALAEPPTIVTVKDTFDNVTFSVNNAILDKGLVIDMVSHTGDMLERTKADVGATRTLFLHADVYSFCSAVVSREVMTANAMNVQYCPYHIFVAQLPDHQDEVVIGHEVYPHGVMDKVNALLDSIIKDATAF